MAMLEEQHGHEHRHAIAQCTLVWIPPLLLLQPAVVNPWFGGCNLLGSLFVPCGGRGEDAGSASLRWCFPDPKSCCAAGRGNLKLIAGTRGGFAIQCFKNSAPAVLGWAVF